MNAFPSWLLSYILNALWQVPFLFLAARFISHVARRCDPRTKHRIWVSALLLELTVPTTSFPLVSINPAALRLFFAGVASHTSSITIVSGPGYAHPGIGIGRTFGVSVTAFYLALLLCLSARLFWNLKQTYDLSRRAYPAQWDEETDARWKRYRTLFHVTEAQLAISSEINGPMTIGIFRRTMLFPEDFDRLLIQDDRDAAMAHEFAHMQRRDFGKNLVYRILSLPLACHPVIHLTLAHLAETREIVCDSIAAQVVAGPDRYAKSLLRLASVLLQTQLSTQHAIGIFDANTLERRIMHLTSKSKAIHPISRLAIAAVSAAIALGTYTSAVALRIGVDSLSTEKTAVAGKATRVSGGVMAGNIVKKVSPIYPQAAKDAGVEGAIVLHAIIDEVGIIQNLTVISGPEDLRASAIDAVRQWTYKPYLLNGNPVEVDTTITVNYSLQR